MSEAWSRIVVSLTVAAAAVALGLRQARERRVRHWDDLDEDDRAHFGRQDLRRGAGVMFMILTALGTYCGSRMSPRLGGAPGMGPVRANPYFFWTWLGVFLLLAALLLLAYLDVRATSRYARRHRRKLAQERKEALRHALGRDDRDRNGHPPAPGPGDLAEPGSLT